MAYSLVPDISRLTGENMGGPIPFPPEGFEFEPSR